LKNKSNRKMKKFILSVFSLVLMASLVACSSTKKVSNLSSSENEDPDTGVAKTNTQAKESNLSLADYLRRMAGVQVMGSGNNVTVYVRGGSASQTSGNTPLYVIDGNQIGNEYSQASNMIDVNDIRYVEVLKDVASTNTYGMRGSNGVIVIHSKQKKKKD